MIASLESIKLPSNSCHAVDLRVRFKILHRLKTCEQELHLTRAALDRRCCEQMAARISTM